MSEILPKHTPEIEKPIDDNARKFVSEPIDPQFLIEHGATSFDLTVDWLETSEANEKKVAYKTYDTGDIQILLISKHTIDGKRSTVKTKLNQDEYSQLRRSSILHLEKRRHEFSYHQNNIPFTVNFDEFTESGLRIVEVDASTDDARSVFDPSTFPTKLTEVTGDIRYYGYRVAHIL